MEKPERLWEIDVLRAFAVLAMVYFHYFYALDYTHFSAVPLFSNDHWIWLGNYIRISFFTLVGIGLGLAWQRSKSSTQFYKKSLLKGLQLIALGGIFTFLSWIFTPDQIVRFGVLSFIGTGVILCSLLIPRWWALALCTTVVLTIEYQWGDSWSHPSLWAYILGFYPSYWPSLDYFPLIPWTATISSGGLLSHLLFKHGQRRYRFISAPPGIDILLWIGQHALLIYLLHLPLIVLTIYLLH